MAIAVNNVARCTSYLLVNKEGPTLLGIFFSAVFRHAFHDDNKYVSLKLVKQSCDLCERNNTSW